MKKNIQNIIYENKNIYKNGFYVNSNGKKVNLKRELHECIKNTETIYRESDIKIVRIPEYYRVKDNLIKSDVIDFIISLNKETSDIVALNFANGIVPGGGYITGATAQEECICRGSLLYSCLINNTDMYEENRRLGSSLSTDTMIYSPKVPIIRNSNGELLEEASYCSFISSSAPNRWSCITEGLTENEINIVLKRRIEKIVKLAVSKNPKYIILGAYGCGVFANSREDVYPYFEEYINRYVKFNEIKVLFIDNKL
ncbi:TIGR02452 family protein [Clostridioides sp. GD02377]|uniref:TIGR02452 family protein n=1 Tax=unclassified Clostridioides TaxID=2635829 RepID=UPI0038A6D86F